MNDGIKMALIAAMDRNRVIGKDNQLLWQLPADMAHFKNVTAHHAVIMGSKTYMSLPPRFRPLPNRFNIVLSRSAQSSNHVQCMWTQNITDAFEQASAYAHAQGQDEYFVIGGGEIYTQALPHADRLYITHVDADYEGDAYFPDFLNDGLNAQWHKTILSEHALSDAQSGKQPAFSIIRYDRIKI
jgi:dihydrofolate reductase